MIYISLPEFYYNNNICSFFTLLSREYSKFFKLPVTISSIAGNFPFNYWNGGFNESLGTALYEEFRNASETVLIPIRFNCSNINLKEEDYDDVMANEILELNDNGSNYISLHDLKLYSYLSSKLKNYKYVFSREASLIYDITPELYNSIIKLNLFKLIEIPETRATDLEFLKQIPNRSCLEIPVNASCNINCKNYMSCKLHEHDAQYDFSSMNNFDICKDNKGYHRYSPLITVEDIQEKYIPMGITHFSVAPVVQSDKNNLVVFLIDLLIKDEFKYKALRMFTGGEED